MTTKLLAIAVIAATLAGSTIPATADAGVRCPSTRPC